MSFILFQSESSSGYCHIAADSRAEQIEAAGVGVECSGERAVNGVGEVREHTQDAPVGAETTLVAV